MNSASDGGISMATMKIKDTILAFKCHEKNELTFTAAYVFSKCHEMHGSFQRQHLYG
jgi:hypothetical protein